jgi:hypothetical protein
MLRALDGISKQFIEVIVRLREKMNHYNSKMEHILNLINSNSNNRNIEYQQLSNVQKKTLHLTVQFAQALKLLLETSILREDGSLEDNCLKTIEPAEKLLLS